MSVTREFHEAFDLPRPDTIPVPPDEDLIRLRMRLIKEEYVEVRAELTKLLSPLSVDETLDTFRNLLKELSDLRYVVEGCAVAFGLDIEGAYLEVHRSNMSKLGEDGKPIYREDGKVLKGPGYTEADLTPFVPPVLEGTVENGVLKVQGT